MKIRIRKLFKFEDNRTFGWLVAVLIVAIGSFATGQSATAKIDSGDIDDMISDYLSVVNVSAVSSPIQARLRVQLQTAIQTGVIDENQLHLWGYGDETVATSDGSLVRDRERLRTRLREQLTRWRLLSAEWISAFDPLRTRFALCQAAPSSGCEADNQLLLQWNHMNRVEATYEQRLRDANGDDAAKSEIIRSRERVMVQLRQFLSGVGKEDLARLGVTEQEMVRLQNRLQNPASSSSSSTSTTTHPKGKP